VTGIARANEPSIALNWIPGKPLNRSFVLALWALRICF
jgi:hypothetical protein